MNQLPPLGGPKDKFTPELRILAASLLSMVVILLWAKYFGPKPSVNPPQKNQATQSAPAIPGSTAGATTANPGSAPSTVSAASVPAATATADSQERTIVVENKLYRVEFSNRGAVVKSWQLKEYKDDAKPPQVLDVVHPAASAETGGWPFALVFDDPQLGNLANTGLYKISSDAKSLDAPADVTFTWSDGHLQVVKKFHFDHSYIVNVETSVTNNGNPVMAGLAWLGGFGDLTVTNPIPVETEFVFYDEAGKLTTFPHKKLKSAEEFGNIWQGGKSWTGIEDRYFAAAFLPSLTAPAPLQVRYWKAWRNIKVDGKDQAEPVPEVATAKFGGAAAAARVCGSKRLRPAEEIESAAALAGEFWLAGIYRRPAVSRLEMDSRIRAELGMGDRAADAGHQHGAVPAAHFQLQNHDENAARGAGSQADPGPL